MSQAYSLAGKRLRACALQWKKYYDMQVRKEKFHVGQWVYYHYLLKSKSMKWQKAYIGPFLIVRLIEPDEPAQRKSMPNIAPIRHENKLQTS